MMCLLIGPRHISGPAEKQTNKHNADVDNISELFPILLNKHGFNKIIMDMKQKKTKKTVF